MRKLDEDLTRLLQSMYDKGSYRLLTLVAGKTLPAIGGNPEIMESIGAYRWMRELSFEMLARSFYKTTSINVCYVYSNIILRSDHPAATLRWLAK
jgi:hypothetical protein